MAEMWQRYGRDVSDVKRVACGDERWTLNFNDTMNDRMIMLLLWRLYGVTLKLELTPYWITTIAPGSEYSSVVVIVIVIITGQP